MSISPSITLLAPVKVNLYLRIVGRRADGFHELETVMVPLDFCDTLTFTPQPAGITLTCDEPALPTDDSNLVVRAARLLAAEFGVTRGARIHLQKRAPLAAGLGGGSSDAAATLRGLNRLWELHAPPARLGELAARLGSDINFFLQDGVAVCRGRGEQVEPIPSRLAARVLLVNPGFGIATKWAYQSWAAAQARLTVTPPDVSVLARALAAGDVAGVGRGMFNSLEAPSVGKYPVLALLKQTLVAAGAVAALMSGSGATVFGLFADGPAAAAAVERIHAEFGAGMWMQLAEVAR